MFERTYGFGVQGSATKKILNNKKNANPDRNGIGVLFSMLYLLF
jgi:hypothetical protein